MASKKNRLTIPMTIDWKNKPNRKYFLRHLIEQNNFTTMAEVGVRDGRTTFYLLDNCPNLIIYGIDLNISKFYNNDINQKYKDRLIPIQGNSSLVANKIPNVDIVFIDADHGFIGCSADIREYLHKVKPGGILSGHDIDYPGVNAAVNKYIKKYDIGPNNVWFTNV